MTIGQQTPRRERQQLEPNGYEFSDKLQKFRGKTANQQVPQLTDKLLILS